MSDRPFPSPREPPEDPSLHVREVDLATMLQPQYWREICPSLHVCDEAFQGSVRPMRGAELEDVAADARERILRLYPFPRDVVGMMFQRERRPVREWAEPR